MAQDTVAYAEPAKRKNTLAQRAARALNMLLTPVGFRLARLSQQDNSDFLSRHLDPLLARELVRSLARALLPVVRAADAARTPAEIEGWVAEYVDYAPRFTVRQSGGGMGYLGGLKLFVMARAIDPELVVESGVWRGFTTEVLERAIAPTARIHSFDPDLSRVAYRSPRQVLVEADWGRSFGPDALRGVRALALFDDHVSQVRRLLEAASVGIRHLIFDDDYPLLEAIVDGWPAMPSISMCYDDYCAENSAVSWIKAGRRMRAQWRPEDLAAARSLIAQHVPLPALFDILGFQPGSKTSYVQLHAQSPVVPQ